MALSKAWASSSKSKETAEFELELEDFKSWFNSARFLNKRSATSWKVTCEVGTEKVALLIMAEVDAENKLCVTICNFSTYEVRFLGTIKTELQMEASNIAQRVLLDLGRRLRVRVFKVCKFNCPLLRLTKLQLSSCNLKFIMKL